MKKHQNNEKPVRLVFDKEQGLFVESYEDNSDNEITEIHQGFFAGCPASSLASLERKVKNDLSFMERIKRFFGFSK